MNIRKIEFDVLPADALIVDLMAKQSGLEPSECARFVYQCGLGFLEESQWPISVFPEIRLHKITESLRRQSDQQSPVSRYRMDDSRDVDRVYSHIATDPEDLD